MNDIKRSVLTEIGIQVDEALERFSNMEDFYDRHLSEFPNNKDFPLFMEQMQTGDYENAFFSCHKLKGIIGNLSIMPLYEIMSKVTECLRNGTDYPGAAMLLPELLREYTKVCNKLNHYYRNETL